MTEKRNKRDPFAAREAQKYSDPIASRELIAATIKAEGKPCSQSKIANILELTTDMQQEALRRRLRAMVRDGDLSQTRKGAYTQVDTSTFISGKVIAHKDGFGFVSPDAGGDDLYLHHREMRKVFDGDKVQAVVINTSRNGKLEGEIRKVVERNTDKVVGKLIIEGDKMRVIPDNPKIQHSIFIQQNFDINAEDGQIVIVENRYRYALFRYSF
jgi:ribonuclease R